MKPPSELMIFSQLDSIKRIAKFYRDVTLVFLSLLAHNENVWDANSLVSIVGYECM